MRHELPARVLDPFLYGEHDGRPFAVLPVIDAPNVPADIEILDPFDLGILELVESGLDREAALAQVCRPRGAVGGPGVGRWCRGSSRCSWPSICATPASG